MKREVQTVNTGREKLMKFWLVFSIAGLFWALLFGTWWTAGFFMITLATCAFYFGSTPNPADRKEKR